MSRFRFLIATAILLLPFAANAQLEDRLRALDAAAQSLHDGQPVSLAECLSVGREGSVALGTYQEDLESAELARKAAWAQWLPDLRASANWQRSERTDFDAPLFTQGSAPIFFTDINGNPLGPLQVNGEDAYQSFSVPTGETADETIEQTFQGASLNTNWTVFSGFSRLAGTKRAGADAEASQATLQYQEALLVQMITNAYYDYVNAILRVGVAEDTEALAARELERSQTYFDLGISTRSDVLQAQVRLQQTRLDAVRERNNERNSFVALAFSMGLPPSAPFPVELDLPELPDAAPGAVGEYIDRGRQNRLDLVAARANLDGRGYAVQEARSGYYPAVQVFASYSLNESETPFRFGAQRNSSVAWGIQGQWAIFDRLQTQMSSRQAVAAKRRAEYSLHQNELVSSQEVVLIHNNVVEALERAKLSRTTVDQATEDLRLANERFKVGAGTSLDVINAQVSLATARRGLVDAQTDFLKFRHQLSRAAGALPD